MYLCILTAVNQKAARNKPVITSSEIFCLIKHFQWYNFLIKLCTINNKRELKFAESAKK